MIFFIKDYLNLLFELLLSWAGSLKSENETFISWPIKLANVYTQIGYKVTQLDLQITSYMHIYYLNHIKGMETSIQTSRQYYMAVPRACGMGMTRHSGVSTEKNLRTQIKSNQSVGKMVGKSLHEINWHQWSSWQYYLRTRQERIKF